MVDTHTAVISEKIKCASFDLSIYPYLDDLSAALAKGCVEAISDLTHESVKMTKATPNMNSADSAFEGTSKESAFYWIADKKGVDCVLASFSPSFVSPLSECLLGGGFKALQEENKLTQLDFELAQTLAHECLVALDAYISEAHNQNEKGIFKSLRSVKTFEEVLKGKEITALFSVSLSLEIDNTELPEAICFHFPIEFLERNGFLEQGRKKYGGDKDNTHWFSNMRSNITNSEIDLSVVLDRYHTTVGDLSRLEVGQLLSLNQNSHHSLCIEMKTQSGDICIAKGRLGTFKNKKAIKVTESVDIDPASPDRNI